jgi:hypothetical protein
MNNNCKSTVPSTSTTWIENQLAKVYSLPARGGMGFKINQEGVQPGTDHLKAITAR